MVSSTVKVVDLGSGYVRRFVNRKVVTVKVRWSGCCVIVRSCRFVIVKRGSGTSFFGSGRSLSGGRVVLDLDIHLERFRSGSRTRSGVFHHPKQVSHVIYCCSSVIVTVKSRSLWYVINYITVGIVRLLGLHLHCMSRHVPNLHLDRSGTFRLGLPRSRPPLHLPLLLPLPVTPPPYLVQILLDPRRQIKIIDDRTVTRQPRVPDWICCEKNKRLDGLDLRQTLAKDVRQSDVTDLLELRWSKTRLEVAVFVPKPVPFSQVEELLGYDAGERGADDSPADGLLGETPREQVDVVDVVVERAEAVNGVGVHDALQVFPVLDGAQTARLPPGGVARKAVVAASLDVDGGEVHAEGETSGLEEVVGELVADELVTSLTRLVAEADQYSVQRTKTPNVFGVFFLLVERHICKRLVNTSTTSSTSNYC